jgi:serine/threonine protein kinase
MALEVFGDKPCPESDVFSFGMILYELLLGHPIFRKGMTISQIGKALVNHDWELDIPEWVTPETEALIRDCLAVNPKDRPSFIEVFNRLELIRFKLLPDVNSVKIETFVKGIEDCEAKSFGERSLVEFSSGT